MSRFVLILVLALLPLARAQAEDVEVDLELLLLVDVSRSMSAAELEIQRRGYSDALRSAPVLTALRAGLLQRVALAYVEWAGPGTQRVIVDWRTVTDRTDLDAFADVLSGTFSFQMRRTSISDALTYGAKSMADNGFAGLRRVIDISGDGPNNTGGPVTRARDAVLAQGIVINGLPLMTRDMSPDGLGGRWHLDDLDIYYRDCVIGGPGAFVIPVYDWKDFSDAVMRKLVLEMVGLDVFDSTAAKVIPIQATAPYDCMIGEKIWERNRRIYDLP